MKETLMKYLKKHNYEIQQSSDRDKHIVFVPYQDHQKVLKYIKKYYHHSYKTRFTNHYEYAAITF